MDICQLDGWVDVCWRASVCCVASGVEEKLVSEVGWVQGFRGTVEPVFYPRGGHGDRLPPSAAFSRNTFHKRRGPWDDREGGSDPPPTLG